MDWPLFFPLSLQINHVKVDSAVFRLHTNATVILLVTFSIAVTTRQYVGNPIDCVHTRWVPCNCRKWPADWIISEHSPSQRHSGRCTQHVLLDPLDVHGGGCVYEKAGLRSAVPRRGQLPEPGQCHHQAYEILSMGGVHAVFSGEWLSGILEFTRRWHWSGKLYLPIWLSLRENRKWARNIPTVYTNGNGINLIYTRHWKKKNVGHLCNIWQRNIFFRYYFITILQLLLSK